MKTIKGDYLSTDIDLDDVILFDDNENTKKDKKSKKKKKSKNKKSSDNFKTSKKSKSKKKKNKKKNKKTYKYKYKNKKGLLGDAINLDVKSNVNIDVSDESIKNIVQSGVDLVKCFMNRSK